MMNSYEKNIDVFLELIVSKRRDVLKIDRMYKYKKPRYILTLPTDIDHKCELDGCIFVTGKVGVYVRFIPHLNEIYLEREDCDEICIESPLLMAKYNRIIEALYHQINNDNVLEFINTSVDYLELKSEHREVKIKSLGDEKE